MSSLEGLSGDGRWSAPLALPPGSHTLSVSASSRFGGYTNTASSTFTAVGSDNITNLYDNAGYLVSRSMANGVQSFKWDAAGRLVRVTLRDAQTNGYDWEAIYAAAGRRLRAAHTAVPGGLADTNRTVTDSFYDPEVLTLASERA